MAGFDMHVHSSASDGALSPIELVVMAKENGLLGMAITDHDTAAGIIEAQKKATELNFILIPGIELSAEQNEKDIHILGYWFDVETIESDKTLKEMRAARFNRCFEIVARLGRLGMELDAKKIIADAGNCDAPGRPHIAKELVAKGYADNIKEAFKKWLSRGRPGYIPRKKLDPYKAIEIINNANGVAVLAHPGTGAPDSLIPKLVKAGLAGIEVYHPDHNSRTERKYLNYAHKYQLAATGGSDFHVEGIRLLGCRITTVQQMGILAAKRCVNQ